ncbi:hypothetical protein DQ04_01701110 [Trypanosoma grayi]|uniref:hypothetical protein n=1 Tax=Trypanosoma grayi TaxID=71804 RepID=UPI0004F4A201|nr:hypothetical protein DQ04_01701110 [Trypanosoma grayi]KEG12460.1 hypothetical protein DQ04_01701110 [Trypanosoma grayi]
MGVAATASREIKAERLRRAVEPLFQLATPLVEEKVESTGAPVVLSPLQLRMPLQFLEPFDVPIVAHSIREMEFYFRLPQHEERPSASPEEVPSPSAGKFCISLDAGDTPDCFLCTLEQQRLLSSLNRWAERLPPPLQMCLRAVFVLQHPRDGATRSWECDFHVTLLLRRDSARFGEQSPLCGPSQPEGTLSFEEQQLVDAVLSAAPLAKRLGVATLCDDGSLCCLYPRPRRVDFTMASDAARAEVVSCAALHGPSGQSVTAALPFMHSSIATTLGAHDMTSLEQPSPSVWRHAMAMEAAGSLLLTFTDTLQYGGGTIVVLAGDESCPQRGVAACPPSSGARLLGEALSQWLFRLPNVSLVRVARKSERAEGKSPSVEIAGVTSEAEIPALWLCLVDSDADVAAVADIVEHSVALLQRESLVEPKRVVLVQLAVDGDFQLLATALQCAMRGLEGRFHLRVDSGAVDIDPWTAAAVGYAVVELSSSAVS